ncbi:MAG: undecaprenyldiphospho-muramoylpentapeptide beta-N-acetylglucosaminyltransferase [Clostridia bacterium]|nr:undecaprenyldiphospho-muramoylpentapeptide beta-N-acetylglucosaminyltransferase [Clostridia bacterium]
MRVILSCGGTGGHIYPAIAIADKIKEKDPSSEILFIGTKTGMENRLVPAAGYEIKGVDASGFNRKHLLANFKTLKNIAHGGHEAEEIIKEFKPDVVIGTGAYVTGIVLLHAHKLKIPCIIHEQNALPGLTNKMVSRFADRVFISFKGTEKAFHYPDRVVYSGNPIRADFDKLDREECRKELGFNENDIVILATGGSLGAEVLNEEIVDFASKVDCVNINLLFVTGKRYYENVKNQCNYDCARVIDYANNMPTLMTASDVVVSRAGAIALAEIMACGKPAIFVPSPNVTNNHQYHNALAVAEKGAAVLVEEKDIAAENGKLASEIFKLIENKETLKAMGEKAKSLATIDAADIIYENLIIKK